jgi:DNA-binding transcriptional MerR regulator
MSDVVPDMTIEELSERTDTPVRTIRFYISEELLPGPRGRGKAATYDEEHLLRLRLIRGLTEQHLPLAVIRDMTKDLSLDYVRALLAEATRRKGNVLTLERESPREYVTRLLEQARGVRERPSQPVYGAPAARPPSPPEERWRRLELAPGVELHLREDAEQRQADLIERLLRAAKGS